MDDIDHIIASLGRGESYAGPPIICFFTASGMPLAASPMRRKPMPPTGYSFDKGFAASVENALRLNRSVHDGAILIGRDHTDKSYEIRGWSFRLHPSHNSPQDFPNRGSAFNSCLSMSLVPGIDRLYLLSNRAISRFTGGVVVSI